MGGWRDFTPFSTEFQLYQDDGLVVDGCVQWNPVYDCKYFRLKRGSNPDLLDQQAGTYTGSPLSLGDGSI